MHYSRLLRLSIPLFALVVLILPFLLLDHSSSSSSPSPLSSVRPRILMRQPTSTSTQGNPADTSSRERITRLLKYWTYQNRTLDRPSELWTPKPKIRFVTFEPDPGGFNNIRMGFEAVIAFAIMFNATLVIPPTQQMYLLHKPSHLGDYFNLTSLGNAIRLLSTEEFLKMQKVSIKYGFQRYPELKPLRDYLRSLGPMPNWDMHSQVLAIPSIKEAEKNVKINAKFLDLNESYPTFEQFKSNRKIILEIEENVRNAEIVHFMVDKETGSHRLFGNFYTFMYFSDPLWLKYIASFMRNNLHFNDHVIETAAKIVAEIINYKEDSSPYYAIHVRRGDFQYKQTRIPPSEILKNVGPLINRRTKIYLSTDEKNRTLFSDFNKRYKIFFLSDFEHHLSGVERKFYGLIEQCICAAAERFIGTELSTFSAFINRMRAFISPELALDKEFYMTTYKYTGDVRYDSRYTGSTWMSHSSPKWPHSPWSRDFQFMWVTS